MSVKRAVVITDTHVQAPHAVTVAEALSDARAAARLDGGGCGRDEQVSRGGGTARQQLLEVGTDRKTVVFAVGGGVIGDLAGFVAATYMRGLALVRDTDNSVGTGGQQRGGQGRHQSPRGQEHDRRLWQPAAVLIDTQVLKSLPQREYRAGLGEVVRVRGDSRCSVLHFLESHAGRILAREDAVLRDVVARCCRLKAEVVEQDEREESGRRAVLNYGHTFGHAIESATRYQTLLHGEAVSIGMLCAFRLAESLGLVDRDFTKRQRDLLVAFGLPVDVPAIDPDAVLDAMHQDKKVADGQLRFVLPDRMGHVRF